VSGSASTLESMASRLVGVWKLVSYTVQEEGRENSLPFGPESEGFLICTPDGFVSAQLMKPGRSLFQGQNWRGGTADEYQQAGSGYIAYCGSYEVDEENETVTHTPSVALVPNLVHKAQSRLITLGGELLTLRALIPMTKGVPVTSRLEWQRVGTQRATSERRSQDKRV
jgi:hypothetical protein